MDADVLTRIHRSVCRIPVALRRYLIPKGRLFFFVFFFLSLKELLPTSKKSFNTKLVEIPYWLL